MANALYQSFLLTDERCHQLRLVYLAIAHGHELMAVIGEAGVYQSLGIVDDSHKGNGVQAKVGPDQQGLGVCVADAANAAATLEGGHILLKFGAEGGVFNVVNLPLKPPVLVIDHHTAPAVPR